MRINSEAKLWIFIPKYLRIIKINPKIQSKGMHHLYQNVNILWYVVRVETKTLHQGSIKVVTQANKSKIIHQKWMSLDSAQPTACIAISCIWSLRSTGLTTWTCSLRYIHLVFWSEIGTMIFQQANLKIWAWIIVPGVFLPKKWSLIEYL